MKFLSLILLALTSTISLSPLIAQERDSSKDDLRVMSWNIWRGGREDGKEIGPQRVVDVIKSSGADIIAMQETYGSGEKIAKALGFHFHPRGTNLSIHSRYPIIEDISVFEEFKCVGALIELPNRQRVAFYNIWLPYGEDIWLPGVRAKTTREAWIKACQPSANDLEKIAGLIKQRLSDSKYSEVSVMVAGDFNSMSHRDYGEASVDQYGQVVDWPTSHILSEIGFRDSYRELNPVVDRPTDATWSPKFPEQEQDRIDFIYYRSNTLRAVESKVIRSHPTKFPSDHAAVLSVFGKQGGEAENGFRVVSYNIKRGFGMDNVTQIERAGDVLGKLKPDFIGLQEIDFNAKRSGSINQMKVLAKQLNMHPAFGKFMDFQGGQYGMGVLTRHPIESVEQVVLPEGNEPRVALAVKVRLPDNSLIMLVNVHFDWVKDDKFRFAQAQVVKRYLEGLKIPFVLMGDFNDQPDSRTVKLFSQTLCEAIKPESDRATFSSTNPRIEIDFIFAGPKARWKAYDTKVITEPVVSDHRPVFSKLELSRQPN